MQEIRGDDKTVHHPDLSALFDMKTIEEELCTNETLCCLAKYSATTGQSGEAKTSTKAWFAWS